MSTPQTNAPEWAASQETPWLTENMAKRIFDAFASKSIIEDRNLTAPPVSCNDGDRFLIDTPATGDWIGRDGQMAIAFGDDASSGWVYAAVARQGVQLYVFDENIIIEYLSGVWTIAPDRINQLGDLLDVDFSGGLADGDTILYDLSNGVWYAGAPAGATQLNDLADVAVISPADGDILVYEGSAQKFMSQQPSSPAGFIAASTTEQLSGTETARASTPDSVAALWERGSDVASAGTISLGEGGYFNITGTTTITDVDFATDNAGRKAWVKFAGILTLTHNASTLILPTGASITTAAGDTACFVSEGSDAIRCVSYQRASGAALAAGSGSNPWEQGSPSVPLASTFTASNIGSSSLLDGTGALVVSPQLGTTLRGWYKTAPSYPYDVYMRAESQIFSTSGDTIALQSNIGIFLRDAADGEQVTCHVQHERISGDEQDKWTAQIVRWSSAGAAVAAPVSKVLTGPWIWLRAQVTSTDITFQISPNAKTWITVGVETLASYIDAADQYGLAAYGITANTEQWAIISYFSTTAP